ncbi:uncharacterized protein LOC133804281 isoform X3 [Humulus lupulus]|uniref:uncharacterized protein LOC133804281 isoform X3 n=1 Tax=Humulus lupulus TaxID=3486 RepID=UPI002B40EC86|nr:uncharacterized protein LOC133804281 isoform X3 [Humulus lupulus]
MYLCKLLWNFTSVILILFGFVWWVLRLEKKTWVNVSYRFCLKKSVMSRGSIYRRRIKVFTVAFIIYFDYKALQRREKWTRKSKRAALWGRAHERNAKRVLNLIVELEGLWVKLGQYLSTRADVLPGAYIALLKQLQDSLPPRPIEEVCRTIEKELGKPMDDLFSDFVKVPLATASIAQVHRATLLDGEEVVVKVQHEGIKAIILEDLKNAKAIVDWIAWAEPQYDFNPMIDEWCKEAPKELDFNLEAENTKTVSKNLCGKTKCDDSMIADEVNVLIPEVIQGDHVALLSAFAEMGLKLRLDLPEQAMELITVFFRATTSANESLESMKSLAEQRNKNMKVLQEKANLNEKEVKRFNPIDAFPGDIVIYSRVLNLLRGLSAIMDVRIIYLDIMRPFAEYALQGNINKEAKVNDQWIYDTPIHSDLEAKLRQLLVELGSSDKILGIQICAYKDGKVVIDTAAGLLGKYDPRPVQPDSLFPVFSVTKGITAGMLHWLVDNGKLKLEENVANIWPEFQRNGKDLIKVHHVLNHTSGLHNAMADVTKENLLLFSDWNECLNCIAMAAPETEPGQEQLYHYLSFGWLCGGIIEHASGRKLQEILEEAIIQPLQIEGELYIGIPPGVESRLAALTVDLNDLNNLSGFSSRTDLPSTFQPGNIAQLATTVPAIFNMLHTRRAIIPAANGHCSARALARYYAALVDDGVLPPPHSSSSMPPLGSHQHIPKFPPLKSFKKHKARRKEPAATSKTKHSDNIQNPNCSKDSDGGNHSRYPSSDSNTGLIGETSSSNRNDTNTTDSSGIKSPRSNSKIFSNPRIHDAFMGVGEYANLARPDGKFGLGFKRYNAKDGSVIGFGHSGMGGSTGYCDVKNRFAIAVTLNKMSFGGVTARIIHFVCSELNIPTPEDYSNLTEIGADTQLNLGRPLIN